MQAAYGILTAHGLRFEKRGAAAEDSALYNLSVEVHGLLQSSPQHIAAIPAHECEGPGPLIDALKTRFTQPRGIERLVQFRVSHGVTMSPNPRAHSKVAHRCQNAARSIPRGLTLGRNHTPEHRLHATMVRENLGVRLSRTLRCRHLFRTAPKSRKPAMPVVKIT